MCSRFSRAPEAKKQAILKAAVDIVAEQGLTASTRQIAQEAGVSEGTIFNHFSHKDDLLNAVYLYIKSDLATYAEKERLRILTGRASRSFDTRQDGWKGLHDRLRLLWDSYVDWGLQHPSYVKTLERLAPTGRITLETRVRSLKLFPVFAEFLANLWTVGDGEDIVKRWEDLYLYRSMMAIGNQTLEAMYERANTLGDESAKADQKKLREAGYMMLWHSVVGILKTGLLPNEDQLTGGSLLSNLSRNRIGTAEISNDFDGRAGEVSFLKSKQENLNSFEAQKSMMLAEQDVERLEALI
ncbi:TetR/AcrR family transcriptional regulator [Acetobacteraceae bacterium]|nr:TetR/AcrR family transcriptional regulator [Acetobacteraceae bacterium]